MRWGRLMLIPVVLLLVGGFLLVRRSLGLDFDPASLHTAVSGMGVWAPLVYMGIVAFRVPLGLPSQLVLVGGGIVFGTISGTFYGALGLLASAAFLFLMARYTGREALVARLPERLKPIHALASTRVGAVFLAVGTGYPFGPITMYHLIAGVTSISFLVFLLSVALGSLVRSATYTFFGSRLLEGDLSGLLEATAVVTAAVVVPLLFPRTRGWLLQVLGRRDVQSSRSRRRA
jgi:uncharacterized membrane protein YdjX (TVP38/TMEM64 family)